MTSTRQMILGIALCATVAVAGTVYESAAWAQGPGSGGWHRHGHPGMGGGFDGGFMAALHELNLSDTQKQSIHSIMSAARTSLQSAHAAPSAAMQAFATALPDDPNYPQLVANAIQQSQQMAAQHIQHMSDIRTQVYAVLSADQKKQLPALLTKIAAERQQKWQQQPAPADGN